MNLSVQNDVMLSNDIVELTISAALNSLRLENDLLKKLISASFAEVTCAVCGKPIENVSLQRMTRSALWHDRNCYQYKPRKIIKLEKEFGCDIVEILKETTKRCGNIKTQCEVLGLSIPYLYAVMKKYCGENHIEFMAKYATGKRKELYVKKLNKQSITQFSEDF